MSLHEPTDPRECKSLAEIEEWLWEHDLTGDLADTFSTLWATERETIITSAYHDGYRDGYAAGQWGEEPEV